MTRREIDQQKVMPETKKPAPQGTGVERGNTELSADELKNVTGGAVPDLKPVG